MTKKKLDRHADDEHVVPDEEQGDAAPVDEVERSAADDTSVDDAQGERHDRTSRVGLLDRGWNRGEAIAGTVAGKLAASRAGHWWKRGERPNIVDWALLVAISGVAYVTFLYGDPKVTFEHSFNFLDSLLDGRPGDFYQVAIDNSTFGHPAVYDIPIYIVFAIWNLPTYLFYRFGDLDIMTSLPAEMWMKTMMVAFTLASAWLILKIVKALGGSPGRAKWAAFFFLSTLTLFVPVLIVVQYDIVPITFMLAGLLAYLRGRMGTFVFWFLMANMFKLFAVFAFVPLVLLREKRLPRAAVQLVVGMLGVLVCRMLYSGNTAYEISTGAFNEGMLERLSIVGFQWQPSLPMPIFITLLVGIGIFSYAKRTTSERELQAFAIYLPLAAFLVFCTTVPMNPYWVALVAPFLILIAFANPRHQTLNSMLEVGLGGSYWMIYMLGGYSMFASVIFNTLLTGRVLDPPDYARFNTPGEILMRLGIGRDERPFLVGFMIACAIAILIVNYPRKSFVGLMPNEEPIKRSVVWMRLGAVAAFCVMLFGMYLLPARPTPYSSETPTPIASTVNVLEPGATVEQELLFNTTLSVDTLRLGLDADSITWFNQATLLVSIENSSGEVVFHDETPVNALESGLTSFETGGIVLQADETYTLKLDAGGTDNIQEPLFVQLNPEQDNFETTGNGTTMDGDLVLVLVGEKQ